MSLLNIYAGSVARKRIQEEGFHAGLFGGFLGASGGPKWFVLAGLDKVIFPEFLDASNISIDIMGSSAGAFRAASPFASRSRRSASPATSVRFRASPRPSSTPLELGHQLHRYACCCASR